MCRRYLNSEARNIAFENSWVEEVKPAGAGPKKPAMTKEEKQVDAKLQELQEEVRRNEGLMRKAFMRYEDLISENASLVASIEALRAYRVERRLNTLKMLLNPRPISRDGWQSTKPE